jgi:FixJ family two-component response regulator
LDSRRTVLVVVPDNDLRRSLSYLLEAEGLSVLAYERLDQAIGGPASDTFHCAVVDEDAIEGHDLGWLALSEIAVPIVILWNRLRSVPENIVAAVLDKPLLGQRVVDAVLAGLDRGSRPPST